MRLIGGKRLSEEYDRGYLAKVFTDIDDQVNNLTEGKVSAVTNASTAAPTTGKHAQGDFVRNSAPVEAGTPASQYTVLGWLCSVGGTPGTWLSVRALTDYDGTATFTTLSVTDNLVMSKTSGEGIKVDPAAPTFGWHDLLGAISIRGTGGVDPAFNAYRNGIREFQFAVNDEVHIDFHMPHDYVPGSDIHMHFHWSHKATTKAGIASGTVTGGSVTWGAEVSYSKGHNQAAFPASITFTVAQNASTTSYQHMIAEGQLSAASPSAAQLDSDDLEVDGLILVRAYLSANNITVSSGSAPAPFLHQLDIHYQSTGIPTKGKAPNFYV